MESIEKDAGGIMILLLYVIAIVLLLSVTVMSTTVMSYKMRLSNVTYVSNAYMSDGGLVEGKALAILAYNEVCSTTEEHITEIVEGTIDSIGRIDSGEIGYVLSPYKKYIHPLDLELLPGEVRKEYRRYFNLAFKTYYTDAVNSFVSRIDDGINVKVTRISSSSSQGTYSLESTYTKNGITRKNGMDIVIVYPQIRFDDDFNFEVEHHPHHVTGNDWRVLYGQ